jgi:hypothetical protein
VAFKTAEAVTAAICEMMSSVKELFQTVTFDNVSSHGTKRSLLN